MDAFTLEFAKLRRKSVWLISLGAAAVCVLWLSVDASRTAVGAPDGTSGLLYGAPLINAIVMTLLAAVVASRVCDVDHEAHALKQLLCLQRPGAVFAAKLACSLVIIVSAIALEAAGIALLAAYRSFADQRGLVELVAFAAAQTLPACAVAVLVQAVSLRWENQFASLALGLALSLAGLFALFFPPAIQRLVPSSYFGLLSRVGMDWDPLTRAVSFHTLPFSWPDATLLALVCAALVAVSARWFSRKEL